MKQFRLALLLVALILGASAVTSLFAETLSVRKPLFPSDPTKIASPPEAPMPEWLQAFLPFRPELRANQALTSALRALRSDREKRPAEIATAQGLVERMLSTAPYDAKLWLALAMLQAKRDPRNPEVVQALQMSYFTAPNESKLMPLRLDTATVFDAVSDPDLKELVRGDLRLMLTRQPGLKTAVVSAYVRASSIGKAFLEDAVQLIDPAFLPVLTNRKPT